MNIALIGSGRVATCMGPQLKAAGHTIACVYSRTMANALELADALGAPATDSLQSLPVADVYLTMLTDDALVELAPAIDTFICSVPPSSTPLFSYAVTYTFFQLRELRSRMVFFSVLTSSVTTTEYSPSLSFSSDTFQT